MRRIKIYHHPTATDGPLVASCDGCSVGIASIADVTGYRAGSEVEVGDFAVTPAGIIEALLGHAAESAEADAECQAEYASEIQRLSYSDMEREYGSKTARMLFGGQECFKESHEKYVRKLLDDAQADIERARRIRSVIRDRTQGDGRASS